MIDEIQKNGGKVISSVTADVPSRVSAIENFISQKVDAIIIEEGDITQVAPPLVEAKKKGIIIGSMDSGDADFVDVFVESDNKQLGTKSAEKLMEYMGHKGKLVEIFNDAGSMIKVRKNALHDVVAQNPDVEIAFGFVYAWPDFLPDAKAKLEAILQAHPKPGEISGVFATFDGVGVAAAQAIREAGLQNYISVTGIDGDPEAYKEMRKADSPFKATLAQDPNTIAPDRGRQSVRPAEREEDRAEAHLCAWSPRNEGERSSGEIGVDVETRGRDRPYTVACRARNSRPSKTHQMNDETKERVAVEDPRVVLEVEGIGKEFNGVWVLQDIALRLAEGEIHTLVGENGAGKSTFIKLLSGVQSRPREKSGSMDATSHSPACAKVRSRAFARFTRRSIWCPSSRSARISSSVRRKARELRVSAS